MTQFSVVPFVASVGNRSNSEDVARQLESLINAKATEGWEYIRLESVETNVAGSNGCFGLGATPATSTIVSVVVFAR
jgi:hypothetical protein